MQENIPFHNISDLESMMMNILDDGQDEVWKTIEQIKLPLKRCKARKLFAQAINKIKENEI